MIIEVIAGLDGLRVEFLDDPYTPVMVYLKDLDRGAREYSATYLCAVDTGAVEDIELTHRQCAFLNELESRAFQHYDKYTIHREAQ